MRRMDEMNLDDASAPTAPTAPAVLARAPRIRALSARQAQVVLARNRVGRIAFVAEGRIELIPVHYVYAAQTIYGRTSFGARCAQWATETDVVFEVDEPEAMYDWRSVIVRGSLRVLPATGSREERAEYWDAVAAIRGVFSDALTERDPTPGRRCVFAIEPLEVSGREASTRFRRD